MRIIVLLISASIFFSCSNDLTGGSTTVENGFVVASVKVAGQGVVATVLLTPIDFNPLVDDWSKIIQGCSDSQGNVYFDSVSENEYTLTAFTDTFGLFMTGVFVNKSVQLDLKKLGALRITNANEKSVSLTGSPYIGELDTVTGDVVFLNIPEGLYPQLVIADSIISTESPLKITAGEEKIINLDNLELTFSLWIDLPQLLKDDSILSVEDGHLGLYFGTTRHGLWSKDDKYTQLYYDESTLLSTPIRGINSTGATLPADSGELMLISTDSGLVFINYLGKSKVDKNSISTESKLNLLHTYVSRINPGFAFCSYDENSYVYMPGDSWIFTRKIGVSAVCGSPDQFYVGYNNGALEYLTKTDTVNILLVANKIHALASSIDKGIIIATDQAIFSLKDDLLTSLMKTPVPVNRLAVDSQNRVWGIHESKGVFMIDDGVVTVYENFANGRFEFLDITTDGEKIYLACGVEGVLVISP